MNNRPQAVLAIWNDYSSERLHEYECWHTQEHVPERVWSPGFVSGRRYRAIEHSEPRYLTLYEVQTLQALERKEYADLVNSPTPWSASMRTSFRNFERQPTEVVADYGAGNGGKLSIVRLVSKTPIEQLNNFGRTAESLFQNLQTGGTCAVRLRVGRTVSGGPQALANVRPPVIGHEYLWAVESVDVNPREFKAHFLFACQTSGLVHDENDATYFGYFEFLSEVDHEAVQRAGRPSPRLDLMKNFTNEGSE